MNHKRIINFNNRKLSFIIISLLVLLLISSSANIITGHHTVFFDDDHIDQFQISWNAAIAAEYPDMLAQSFVPTENILTRVQILMHKIEVPTQNISVSIRKSLNGVDLTSIELQPEDILLSRSWIEFNFPNISVIPYETYYIIWKPLEDHMYYFWWGYDNANFDSYPSGEAWLFSNGQWDNTGFVIKDWSFKTYGFHASQPPDIPSTPIGPTEGLSWTSLNYETVTTDPDLDKVRYGWDWDGDNIVDEWTDLYNPGEVINISHSWDFAGTYEIKVKAEDRYGVQSTFSLPLSVNISNNPPSIPQFTTNSTVIICLEENNFSVNSNDPEGQDIQYGWDWDGDDIVDEWTELYHSGDQINVSHSWSQSGIYYVCVKSKDELGACSYFSNKTKIVVINIDNDPPNKPDIPKGSTRCFVGVSYSYTSSATDPDGDRIYYQFDWDDGSKSEWFGPYLSGQSISISHIWEDKGSFQIKIKAKDVNGEESVWSDPLAISLPKVKQNYILFYRLVIFMHSIIDNHFFL